MSPTQRTLAWLRKQGYTAGVVEKWNQHARIRQDLFGFIDLIALHPESVGTLAVQATSGSNVSSRVEKIRESIVAPLWLAAGNAIWVVGWRKVATRRKDGTKGVPRWSPRVVEVEAW